MEALHPMGVLEYGLKHAMYCYGQLDSNTAYDDDEAAGELLEREQIAVDAEEDEGLDRVSLCVLAGPGLSCVDASAELFAIAQRVCALFAPYAVALDVRTSWRERRCTERTNGLDVSAWPSLLLDPKFAWMLTKKQAPFWFPDERLENEYTHNAKQLFHSLWSTCSATIRIRKLLLWLVLQVSISPFYSRLLREHHAHLLTDIRGVTAAQLHRQLMAWQRIGQLTQTLREGRPALGRLKAQPPPIGVVWLHLQTAHVPPYNEDEVLTTHSLLAFVESLPQLRGLRSMWIWRSALLFDAISMPMNAFVKLQRYRGVVRLLDKLFPTRQNKDANAFLRIFNRMAPKVCAEHAAAVLQLHPELHGTCAKRFAFRYGTVEAPTVLAYVDGENAACKLFQVLCKAEKPSLRKDFHGQDAAESEVPSWRQSAPNASQTPGLKVEGIRPSDDFGVGDHTGKLRLVHTDLSYQCTEECQARMANLA